MDRTSATGFYTDATGHRVFVDADLANGVDGSDCNGVWLTGMQEEVAGVIEGAGIVLSAADNTQLRQALARLTTGRVISVTDYTIETSITPVAGAGRYIIEGVGGGASGGCAAPTGPGQGSVGGGGGASAYAKWELTASQFNSLLVNGSLPCAIGAGGAIPAGQSGGNPGGATTIAGNALVVPGGRGGGQGYAVTLGETGGSASSDRPSCTIGMLRDARSGTGGWIGLVLNGSTVFGGRGGDGVWGTGGGSPNGQAVLNGVNGDGYGAGASGGAVGQNGGTFASPGAGSPGRLRVTALS